MFLYKPNWSWDSLPKSYVNGAYICADANALAQASMLVASTNEGTGAIDEVPSNLIPDDQSSSLLGEPENQSTSDIVTGDQTSPFVVAPFCEVSDNPSLVERVIDDLTISADVDDIQDGINTCESQQVATVSDLKKRVSA